MGDAVLGTIVVEYLLKRYPKEDQGFLTRMKNIIVRNDMLCDYAKELGLEKNCTWLGTRPHDEVLRWFKKSDLFILGCEVAENGDRDGIPNVLVESLAMGLPAISTTVSAISELVEHEVTGLTVPPTNSKALADAIVKLLVDTHLRRKVITNGQRRVNQQFDNLSLTKQLASIFTNHIEQLENKEFTLTHGQ
jgi:glycosyltransferase involved in cell wall biosynthesis